MVPQVVVFGPLVFAFAYILSFMVATSIDRCGLVKVSAGRAKAVALAYASAHTLTVLAVLRCEPVTALVTTITLLVMATVAVRIIAVATKPKKPKKKH